MSSDTPAAEERQSRQPAQAERNTARELAIEERQARQRDRAERDAARERRFDKLMTDRRFVGAEELARDWLERFPNSGIRHLRLALVLKAQGKFREASNHFEAMIDQHPEIEDGYAEYSPVFRALHAGEPDRIRQYFESFLAHHPTSEEAIASFGAYLRDHTSDAERSRQVLTAGLEHHPDSTALRLELLKLAIHCEDIDAIVEIKSELSERGCDYEDAEALFITVTSGRRRLARDGTEPSVLDVDRPCTTLDDLIGPPNPQRPRILEAEGQDFAAEHGDTPVIALFAYRFPRPNLDVIYEIYKLLTERGYTALLFLRASEVDDFDFSEISFEADDVFYSCWPGFFASADFVDCVVTNDQCRIDARSLPDGCKLVFHCPHNTNVGPEHKSSFKAHYGTYLNHHPAPQLDSAGVRRFTPSRVCLMPNSYTKDEYLSRFVHAFPNYGPIIGYCPTSLMGRFEGAPEGAEFQAQVADYLGAVTQMIDALLAEIESIKFIYRPFWTHGQHWVLTNPLIDRYGSDDRFVVDTRSNSKYTVALSDVFITDVSGLANTYSTVKSRGHIAFDPELEPRTHEAINCETVDQVVAAARTLLTVAEAQRREPPELGPGLGGITYLVDNIDHVLEDRPHPDWHYFDLA